MKFQEKLVNQIWENSKKPSFGLNLSNICQMSNISILEETRPNYYHKLLFSENSGQCIKNKIKNSNKIEQN